MRIWNVWTCIWVSGLVFWVSGLVFWMSGLDFWVFGLVCVCVGGCLGVWTCILGVWTCILGVCILVECLYNCRMWLWRARLPPQTTPWSVCLPQAFFFPKNDAPGIFEHVYCHFSQFSWIVEPPLFFFEKWAIWSNDYASKTRIEILCTNTCCVAGDVQSKSDFLDHSWKYRTLARMSTWTIGWQFFIGRRLFLSWRFSPVGRLGG